MILIRFGGNQGGFRGRVFRRVLQYLEGRKKPRRYFCKHPDFYHIENFIDHFASGQGVDITDVKCPVFDMCNKVDDHMPVMGRFKMEGIAGQNPPKRRKVQYDRVVVTKNIDKTNKVFENYPKFSVFVEPTTQFAAIENFVRAGISSNFKKTIYALKDLH